LTLKSQTGENGFLDGERKYTGASEVDYTCSDVLTWLQLDLECPSNKTSPILSSHNFVSKL
jgi:hypothetical protein